MSEPFTSCLGRTLDTTLALFFQTTCIVCHNFSGSQPVCRKCRQFPTITGPLCDRCGEPTNQAINECGRCQEGFLKGILRCRSLVLLDESMKTMIHTIKYRRYPELLNLFRDTVSEFEGEHTVIPVPMHWKKRIERGFNQSEILAAWFVNPDANFEKLKKLEPTAPQVFLSKKDRQTNQHSRYQWASQGPAPQSVLLIDDVLTTGATLSACARTLRQAGTHEVYAWTLFRTQKR